MKVSAQARPARPRRVARHVAQGIKDIVSDRTISDRNKQVLIGNWLFISPRELRGIHLGNLASALDNLGPKGRAQLATLLNGDHSARTKNEVLSAIAAAGNSGRPGAKTLLLSALRLINRPGRAIHAGSEVHGATIRDLAAQNPGALMHAVRNALHAVTTGSLPGGETRSTFVMPGFGQANVGDDAYVGPFGAITLLDAAMTSVWTPASAARDGSGVP